MSFAPFGTAHEELEDEKNTGISRRPTRVEDEIVTDEKGRRRFHGAFTGGFSAGYFNTVGSKQGWEPQTFKSTRNERAEKYKATADDYMDEEDRGEFGFAAKKIRVRDDFLEKVTGDGGIHGQPTLAWERSGASTSNASMGINDLAAQLEKTICPVNDSVGVRILKKMGWRPGKGIGPRMTRRALEKRKVLDARSRGESTRFDEKAVRDIEELAPDMEFAPDDIPRLFVEANNSRHGIGYKPLEQSNVLSESFAFKVDALKTKMQSKGIRGQAFGVGAYEEDDDDIYTSEDLSKYDYAIGGPAQNLREIERYDSNFVAATEVERPVFYHAPQPTRHFDPRHKAQPIILKNLPEALTSAVQNLTPLQKAVFLGDRSGSIMELLSDSDRQKLELLTRKTEKEVLLEDKKRDNREERRRVEPEPFEEEPLKAHRFKKYVHYLKSGYDMPAPMELTRLEWERELTEFENHLTPELRSLLPSVRSRQEPLANLKTAQPIADLLKSRFHSENSSDTAKTESKLVVDRREAVKKKEFGPMTRTKYKWHPSKLLCKYFNVEDPYPGSQMVGTLELQKRVPPPQMSSQIDSLGNLGLPNTQRDVIDRMGREAQDRRLKDGGKSRTRWDEPANDESKQRQYTVVEKPTFLPPVELLQSVFELPDLDKSSSSSSEDEDTRPTFESISKRAEKPAQQSKEKFITVLDLIPDEYGPQIPKSLPKVIPVEEKVKIIPVAPQPEIVQLDSSDESTNGSRHRSEKKRKRSKSHKESSKKLKKEKKKKDKSEKSTKDRSRSKEFKNGDGKPKKKKSRHSRSSSSKKRRRSYSPV